MAIGRSLQRSCYVLLAIFAARHCCAVAAEQRAECVVATVQPLATDAGAAAFERGGNAVDAAIAAALTLGVVDNHNSGLGGGCFILLRLADGTLAAIDGRETAPAAATRDMFLRDGQAVAEWSQTGPLASGVPGALAAYELALSKYGKLGLAELLIPAAEIAENGFALDRVYARRLASTAAAIRKFPATAAILLKPNGQPWARGEMLRQVELGRTYREIAEHGVDWFYRGPLARRVAAWMADNGGLLCAADFAAYRARLREPVVSTYRGHEIIGFPPPSSGGVHVAQILNIVEQFDLAAEHAGDADQARHLVVEAMKLAFADRAHWLGDADFVDVPRGLIDKQYATELARRIDRQRASPVAGHNVPPAAGEDLFGKKHTTHIAAADTEGNWAAITATVNTSFGSKVIVPGTGLVLNNEMDDFSAQPGVPNAFGLVGAENNAVAPGKRPLSSMSPTIVLRDGAPVMTLGAAGGPKIITQVVVALIRTIDYRQSLEQAVAGWRYHHQWRPDQVWLEGLAGSQHRQAMEARGHAVQIIPRNGVTQAIGVGADGRLTGVHDPRVPGKVGRAIRLHTPSN